MLNNLIGGETHSTATAGTICDGPRCLDVTGLVSGRPALRLGRGGGAVDIGPVISLQGEPATRTP